MTKLEREKRLKKNWDKMMKCNDHRGYKMACDCVDELFALYGGTKTKTKKKRKSK